MVQQLHTGPLPDLLDHSSKLLIGLLQVTLETGEKVDCLAVRSLWLKHRITDQYVGALRGIWPKIKYESYLSFSLAHITTTTIPEKHQMSPSLSTQI